MYISVKLLLFLWTNKEAITCEFLVLVETSKFFLYFSGSCIPINPQLS
jgi:hypothetical protein